MQAKQNMVTPQRAASSSERANDGKKAAARADALHRARNWKRRGAREDESPMKKQVTGQDA